MTTESNRRRGVDLDLNEPSSEHDDVGRSSMRRGVESCLKNFCSWKLLNKFFSSRLTWNTEVFKLESKALFYNAFVKQQIYVNKHTEE